MSLFVTKTVEFTEYVKSTKEVLLPNWAEIPSGTKFKGSRNDGETQIEGRLLIEDDNVYMCTDNAWYNGAKGSSLLGYAYSYALGTVDADYEFFDSVEFELDPSFVVEPIIKVGEYSCAIAKGFIMVGCTQVSNELVREIASKLID